MQAVAQQPVAVAIDGDSLVLLALDLARMGTPA